jgi:hypothetical protein
MLVCPPRGTTKHEDKNLQIFSTSGGKKYLIFFLFLRLSSFFEAQLRPV